MKRNNLGLFYVFRENKQNEGKKGIFAKFWDNTPNYIVGCNIQKRIASKSHSSTNDFYQGSNILVQ